jgi:outer membrane protein TolC
MATQAADRLRAVAIDARSQVRESYLGYRSAYELARHYRDEILPLRKRISDEQLLRYNGMLISVFELIEDSRQQVASVSASIDALREYWLAESGLQSAMLTGMTPGDGMSAAAMPGSAGSGGH